MDSVEWCRTVRSRSGIAHLAMLNSVDMETVSTLLIFDQNHLIR
jgi:hypothetical protein